jgi:hypothetical protein
LAGELERACGRQLDVAGALEVADPDGAVDGRAADRAVALGDDLARGAAQPRLAMGAEEAEAVIEQARVALVGVDAADDRRRRVLGPVDPPAQHWTLAAGDGGVGVVERFAPGLARGDLADGLDDRLDRGAADLVAVEAALAGGAHGERARGPDVAAVELVVGLEHGHAPLGRLQLDRPVQRRRAAVAHRARVDDEAAMPRPDALGDDRLEHRAHDQLGLVAGDRGLDRGA